MTHDHNAFVANLTIPDALKAETYERRTFEGSFHRLNLAIRFHSGNDGVGAVVKHFIDAIPNHDKMVKRVEDSLLHMEGLKSVLKKKNCLFKNLDSSFNTLLTNPDELDEYMDLIPKMKNIDARIKAIRQTEARVKAELEVPEYCHMYLLTIASVVSLLWTVTITILACEVFRTRCDLPRIVEVARILAGC